MNTNNNNLKIILNFLFVFNSGYYNNYLQHSHWCSRQICWGKSRTNYRWRRCIVLRPTVSRGTSPSTTTIIFSSFTYYFYTVFQKNGEIRILVLLEQICISIYTCTYFFFKSTPVTMNSNTFFNTYLNESQHV